MRKQNPDDSKDILQAPAFPHNGRDLFTRVRAALAEFLGWMPNYPQLARMSHVGSGKLHYWFNVFEHHHVVCFLSLIERLPEAKRIELLRYFCRELPTLNSPRFAHDITEITSLRALLKKSNGITFFCNGTPFHRTFLLMAMAHGILQLDPRNLVTGLDIHEPRTWVPVDGVLYVRQPTRLPRLKQLSLELWDGIASSKASLVILNGIWSLVPELQLKILDLATRRHVAVADEMMPDQALLASRFPSGSHLVCVQKPHHELIHFHVHPLTISS